MLADAGFWNSINHWRAHAGRGPLEFAVDVDVVAEALTADMQAKKELPGTPRVALAWWRERPTSQSRLAWGLKLWAEDNKRPRKTDRDGNVIEEAFDGWPVVEAILGDCEQSWRS